MGVLNLSRVFFEKFLRVPPRLFRDVRNVEHVELPLPAVGGVYYDFFAVGRPDEVRRVVVGGYYAKIAVICVGCEHARAEAAATRAVKRQAVFIRY